MKLSFNTFRLLAVVILVGYLIFHVSQRSAGVTHTGVSSHKANQHLPPALALPNAAADASVYVDFGAAASEFELSEADFLTWCEARGWAAQPIATPVEYGSNRLPTDTHHVNRGYTFEPPDGRGVFDADRSRACFSTLTFP